MPNSNSHKARQVHRRILSDLEKGEHKHKEEGSRLHPSLILVYVFLGLIALGSLLLWLPWATTGDKSASFVTSLFTAASAATGTGLVVVDTATYWSYFGQQIILGLIQLGGLAALIGSSIFLLRIARRATGEERFLLRESMHVSSGRGIAALIVGILFYALIVEAAGTWLLYRHFCDSQTQPVALWLGLFHSISAFNNAGFEIMGLANYGSDTIFNLVLAGLSIVGSVSFLVAVELAQTRSFSRLSLNSKLVMTTTFWLLGVGTLVILLVEFSNPSSLGYLPFLQKLQAAFFHSATARTTGLSTLDIGKFTVPTLLFIVALMFIGGASGSTAGGIKVNTFGLLVAATRAAIQGKKEVELLGGQANAEQVNRAIAITFLSIILVAAITFLLTMTDRFPLLNLLFEVVSAFSTTGYSTGITPDLSVAGKLLIILAMFAGRVGPLTLAFALAHHRPLTRYDYAQEAINLG